MTNHMAREGETEYLVIARNRSGQDSGSLDYRVPHQRIEDLCRAEQNELVLLCLLATEAIIKCCKLTPKELYELHKKVVQRAS